MKTPNAMTILPLLITTVFSLFFTVVEGSVCCNNPFGVQACKLTFGNDCGSAGTCDSSLGCAAEAMDMGLTEGQVEKKVAGSANKDKFEA